MALTLSGTNGVVGAGFTVDASGVSVTAGVGTFGSLAAPAAGLTGALPAISAASLTQIPAANIVGVCTSGLTKTGGFGTVLQVKQTVKLDSFSTTSLSDVDVTGFSVAITPTSSSNKVLVMVNLALSSQSMFVYGILKRGSTQIGEADGASNRLRPTFMSYNTNEGTVEHQNFQFLDSPNTTSETTYKMQVRCATSGHLRVNQTYRDTDTVDYDPRVSSTITVMEIAA